MAKPTPQKSIKSSKKPVRQSVKLLMCPRCKFQIPDLPPSVQLEQRTGTSRSGWELMRRHTWEKHPESRRRYQQEQANLRDYERRLVVANFEVYTF